jgi:large subunit ribosomal protein L10
MGEPPAEARRLEYRVEALRRVLPVGAGLLLAQHFGRRWQLPTQDKMDRVAELQELLERSTITFGADYTRTSVNQMTELRRAMRANDVDFTIVKNTLMYLAADQAGRPQVKDIIQGPTAVAFGYDDPAAAAKALADYARANANSFSIRGAVMGDGAPMGPDGVNRLATLPPRPQLIATLLAQMQAPMSRLVSALNGPLQGLDNVLRARMGQIEGS